MPDFNVRSDSVNVEQIMDQIRARIREKRGVDYTEQQIRELAAVKLEKFLDPRGVRSDLLEQFRKAQPAYKPPELPNYAFEDQTLYESTRPPLRWIRRLLNPILKLFFNPNPLIQALNIQSRLNTMYGEREARREATRRAFDQLQYELMHNLVIETTRMSIEVKNLRMRVESLAGRLEFNERRARALESVVAYKPSAEDTFETPPSAAPGAGATREPGPVVTTVAAPSAFREPQGRPDSNRGASQSGQSGQPPQVLREPQGRPDQSRGPASPAQIPAAAGSGQPGEGPGQRSRRRRRRRGRRGGGGSAVSMMGGTSQGEASGGSTAAPQPASSPSDQSTDVEPAATSSSSDPDHPAGSGSDSSTGSGSEPSSGSGQDASTRPDQDPQARSGQDDPQ